MPDVIVDRSSVLGPGATERFVDVTGLNEMAQQVVPVGPLGGPIGLAIPDGADVTQGAIADAAVNTDAPGTINGHLRGLVERMVNFLSRLPATLGANGGLKIEGVAGGVAVPVSLAALPVPAVRTPIVDVATGAAAIAKSSAAHTTAFLLHAVTCHFNAAPTTSESLTVTLNALAGAPYDTTLCKVNPSVGALTDIVYLPEVPLLCQAGDVIDVAFANTNTKTYGVRIVTEDV